MFAKVAITATALLIAFPAMAVDTAVTITLTTPSGAFEQQITQYDCGTESPLAVTYVNAAPNFLAIFAAPEETGPLVFASVQSGSGARYAAGKWIWWTKSADANLFDATLGDNAEPVLTCTEINNTP